MANHASSKKRIRQTEKRTERLRHVRSTLRTYVKRTRDAIAKKDHGQAQGALKEAMRRIDMAVSKGVLHRKTASRYISRLAKQVAAIAS